MRYVIASLLTLWFLLLPSSAPSQELSCPDLPDVVVASDDDKDKIVEICLAAEKAIHFLAGYRLVPKRPIYFEIIEEKIDSRGYKAYGSYDSSSDRIQLMSYAAIQRATEHPRMYGESFDRVHYAGAIAHEVAHAVVQHNLKFKQISIGPQEYLAHATQLAVMPQARREAIIAAMDVEPWLSGDEISDIYMAIDPGKFAVKSYRHMTTMVEPAAFMEILLTAKWFYVYVP